MVNIGPKWKKIRSFFSILDRMEWDNSTCMAHPFKEFWASKPLVILNIYGRIFPEPESTEWAREPLQSTMYGIVGVHRGSSVLGGVLLYRASLGRGQFGRGRDYIFAAKGFFALGHIPHRGHHWGGFLSLQLRALCFGGIYPYLRRAPLDKVYSRAYVRMYNLNSYGLFALGTYISPGYHWVGGHWIGCSHKYLQLVPLCP